MKNASAGKRGPFGLEDGMQIEIYFYQSRNFLLKAARLPL